MKSIRKGIEDFLGGIFAAVAMVSLISGVKPVGILKEAGIKIAKELATGIAALILIVEGCDLLRTLDKYATYSVPMDYNYCVTLVFFVVINMAVWYLAWTGFSKMIDVDRSN
jgi:hypothetical protein